MTIPPLLSERLSIGPVAFRKLLVRTGPTFIKIGQFLSLRPDLIPQAYCDELIRLLDRVPPFPWKVAREILREDLARDPREVFASIDARPVAAGSFAQVHRASLRDGTQVAIKVQRPGIRRRVQQDLRRARELASLLGYVITSPQALIRELREWMVAELDMERELDNLTRLRALAENSPIEVIPRPYPHLSSKRILVTTYVNGLRFTDILTELRSRPDHRSLKAEARGIDLRTLANHLFEATLRQIFRYQFFHADLHPGNLFALSGNRIGYVDFGLCAQLDQAVRRKQLRYFEAVYAGRTEQIVTVLSEVLVRTPKSDVEGFRGEALSRTSRWVRERNAEAYRGTEEGHHRSATGQWLVDVMRLARTYRMEVPPGTLSLYRALLTAESVTNELHLSMEFDVVSRKFFASLETILGSVRESLWRSRLETIRVLRGFAEAYLENVDGSIRILRCLMEGPSSTRGADLARMVVRLADLTTRNNSRTIDRFYRAYKNGV